MTSVDSAMKNPDGQLTSDHVTSEGGECSRTSPTKFKLAIGLHFTRKVSVVPGEEANSRSADVRDTTRIRV